MKIPSNKVLAFNGAAMLIIGAAVVTQIRSLFTTPEVPSCATYYEHAVGLGLERAGNLITAADIQAGAAGADYGVLQNLTMERLASGPAPAAMTISVRNGSGHPNHARDPKGGASFPWKPRSLPPVLSSVCLSYYVKLPEQFSFGTGVGTLPGVSAASQSAQSDEVVSVHFGWANGGRAQMRLTRQTAKGLFRDSADSALVLPRGRWFRVDQEIGFSLEGVPDGMLRFWIDGQLTAERRDVLVRASDEVQFDGVLGDIHFGASPIAGEGRATQDDTIMVSPFELRWRK